MPTRVYHPTASSFRDVETGDVKAWTDQGWTTAKRKHIDDSEWPAAPTKAASGKRTANQKASEKRTANQKASGKRAPAKATKGVAETPTVSSGSATSFPEAGKSETAETVIT